ncbi:hypothetical protein LJB88_02465 [Erysipelotrichaceae bacterium OttesenSCG-928-M19]|nr:hypothetical protein [Erysipelotrichaceae bacterium OttesenSCG-928-M19]
MAYYDVIKNLRTQREMEATIISSEFLLSVIDHVRLASSARNEQILRYALVNDDKRDLIFNTTNLPISHKIPLEEAPSAYIVIGTFRKRNQETLYGIDIGIAVQIIREYLFEQDYASVCINSFDRAKVKEIIGVEDFYPENLIAIGKSHQVIRLEDSDEEVNNYRNDNNEHTVKKLKTDKLVIYK